PATAFLGPGRKPEQPADNGRTWETAGQPPPRRATLAGMNTFPTVDESRRRLHRAAWSVGEFATLGAGGMARWCVNGRNGENAVEAAGAAQTEAWYRACQQAEALGMLRR